MTSKKGFLKSPYLALSDDLLPEDTTSEIRETNQPRNKQETQRTLTDATENLTALSNNCFYCYFHKGS